VSTGVATDAASNEGTWASTCVTLAAPTRTGACPGESRLTPDWAPAQTFIPTRPQLRIARRRPGPVGDLHGLFDIEEQTDQVIENLPCAASRAVGVSVRELCHLAKEAGGVVK
jgi:hypothetical protein